MEPRAITRFALELTD